MSDLGPQARRLIAVARSDRPDPWTRRRVRRAVVAAGSAGLGTQLGSGASRAAGTMGAPGIAKVVTMFAAAGMGALLVAGAASYVRHSRRPAVIVGIGARPAASDESAAPGPTVPSVSVTRGEDTAPAPAPAEPLQQRRSAVRRTHPVVEATTAPRGDTTSGDPSAGSLAEEALLLRDALTALRGGNSADALAKLDEHSRRFPGGALQQERAAARIVALCSTGRRAEGEASLREFLRRWPTSPSAARLRGACETAVPDSLSGGPSEAMPVGLGPEDANP